MYFNMHKVKFDQMNKMFEKHVNGLSKPTGADSMVNVFINLEPIIRRLSRPDIIERMINDPNKELRFVSNVINLAAHYRLYFKHLRMKNRLYLYFGYPFTGDFGENMDVKGYRKSYRDKFTIDPYGAHIGTLVDNALPIIKTILTYIGGVYLLTADYYEPSLIPHIIEDKYQLSADLNVLVTNDRYEYQYASHDWLIIRPKTQKHYMINPMNVLEVMALEDKVGVSTTGISNGYLPIILSFLGSQDRDIEKIHGVGMSRMITMIQKGIRTGHLTKNTTSFQSFSAIIKDDVKQRILDNYIVTDLETQYAPLRNSKSLKTTLDMMMVDHYDNVGLKKINEQYFEGIDSHIMIQELLPDIQTRRIKFFDDRRRY